MSAHRSDGRPPYARRRWIALAVFLGLFATQVGATMALRPWTWVGWTDAPSPLDPAAAGPAPVGGPITPLGEVGSDDEDPFDQYRRDGWIAAENARPGTADWQVGEDRAAWDRVSGYADQTSVDVGDSFVLYVSTIASTFTVEAYRLGFYAGKGGRLIWRSDPQPGVLQPPPTLDETTGTRECDWAPSLTVDTDASWPPGQYVLKLTSDDGGASMVPIVVRDDASHADLVMMSAVTTWQAYNAWGGADLYNGPGGGDDDENRSTVVSFDRPYADNGSGHLFGGEFELLSEIEALGLDVTYWTNIDLHLHGEDLRNHRALLSLSHDEYWSTAMRSGAETARDEGVNLAFFGANAVYRRVRLEDSPLGPARRLVNYRSAAADPMTGVDDTEVTTSWREAPDPRPESELIGNYYECNPVEADMVVVNPGNWVFEGTGVSDGSIFPGLVGNEYDRVTPEAPTPDNIEVLAHSPVSCRGVSSFADMTYYTAPSGAGVFATGTLWWLRHLTKPCPDATVSTDCQLRRITENILRVFGAGPAGQDHPSTNNLEQFGIRPGYISPVPAA